MPPKRFLPRSALYPPIQPSPRRDSIPPPETPPNSEASGSESDEDDYDPDFLDEDDSDNSSALEASCADLFEKERKEEEDAEMDAEDLSDTDSYGSESEWEDDKLLPPPLKFESVEHMESGLKNYIDKMFMIVIHRSRHCRLGAHNKLNWEPYRMAARKAFGEFLFHYINDLDQDPKKTLADLSEDLRKPYKRPRQV